MALEIANEIKKQIGNRALYMIGAKSFIGGDDFLQFKIMRNHNKIQYIKITLVGDLYLIQCFRMTRNYNKIFISSVNGVYNYMLRKVIESETGLITKL